MKITLTLLFCFLFILPNKSEAQLVVDTVTNVQQMVSNFFGSSMSSISNLQTKGAFNYRGIFNGVNTNLGIDSGIILTNGDIVLAIGPNDTVEVGIFNGSGLPGDNDLTNIAGYATQDASVIEFDFIAASDTIKFTYVFGSDEYPEWVSSLAYNDLCAIILDGVNIALLPDGMPVCVNKVNCFGANINSYRCNDPVTSASSIHCNTSFNCPASVGATSLEYDGLTVPLTATAILTPGSMHHLKIGIADASDNGADAGVFLKVNYSTPIVSGITNTMTNSQVKIFPNPNSGTFQYFFPDGNVRNLKVIDQLGREVFTSDHIEKNGTLILPQSVAPGVYWLMADSDKGIIGTKIVVVK